MSYDRSSVNEQRNIEITYFTSPPPEIVFKAASIDYMQLTPDEFGEALRFSQKHSEKLEVDAEVSNDEIVQLVQKLGGQGPILVLSVYSYTIEAPHKGSTADINSDGERAL